jgi:[ribosomal protein S5]-alanine N-acetyltransferase
MKESKAPTLQPTTDRASIVVLRRATPADAGLIASWRAEPSARRFQPLKPLSADELRVKLEAQAPHVVDNRLDADLWWIVDAGGPVGWVSLKDISREHGLGAIGYTIGERFRGRGYATAAVRALLRLAFGPVALFRLEAIAAVENAASRRVLDRAGFRLEGIARAHLVIGGERVDHARYALLRPEWEGLAGEDRL